MAHRSWISQGFLHALSTSDQKLSSLARATIPGVKKQILLPNQESPSGTRTFSLTHQGLIGLPGFIFQLEEAPFQLFFGSLSFFPELLLPGQPLVLHLEAGGAIVGGVAAESHLGLSEMHQMKKGLPSSWDVQSRQAGAA